MKLIVLDNGNKTPCFLLMWQTIQDETSAILVGCSDRMKERLSDKGYNLGLIRHIFIPLNEMDHMLWVDLVKDIDQNRVKGQNDVHLLGSSALIETNARLVEEERAISGKNKLVSKVRLNPTMIVEQYFSIGNATLEAHLMRPDAVGFRLTTSQGLVFAFSPYSKDEDLIKYISRDADLFLYEGSSFKPGVGVGRLGLLLADSHPQQLMIYGMEGTGQSIPENLKKGGYVGNIYLASLCDYLPLEKAMPTCG